MEDFNQKLFEGLNGKLTTKATTPIKRHGGKHYLTSWIVGIISKIPHLHYSEPFFGGGSVLLGKSFYGISEVVNDLDSELTNFWNVLKNDLIGLKLKLEQTPFSQIAFQEAATLDVTNPVERAANFFVRVRQSRQGLAKDFATLSKNRTRSGMNEQVSAWLSSIDGLPEVHDRIKQVVILNMDALKVIKQEDSINTLQYLDPTYEHLTRSTVNEYTHEMSYAQHLKLIDLVLNLKSKFAISMYHCPMYDTLHLKHGWKLFEKDVANHASSAETKERKNECLWVKDH